MYQYEAVCVRVVDGDTALLSVDAGFGIHYLLKCRLARINAPELSTDAGVRAAKYLPSLLAPSLIITTRKDGKDNYGRYLAEIFSPISPAFTPPTLPDHAFVTLQDAHGKSIKCVDVNEAMLLTGHAQPYPAVKP